MPERATNTHQEWLDKTLNQVQLGKTTQDALSGDNFDFVTGLETQILQRMHQPVDAVTGQQPGGGPAPSQVPVPGPGAMAAGPMPMPPGGGGPAGPSPMGGSMPVPALPPVDELARIMAQAG